MCETEYILEKDFPFGLEELLKDEYDIEEMGLNLIAKIESDNISRTEKGKLNNENMKDFLNSVEDNCTDKRLWALFGSDNGERWLPLQVASVSAKGKDIRGEIKSDFIRMTPFNPELDTSKWGSCFHDDIMQVEIGKDIVCQKYYKIKEKCAYLAVAILTSEEYDDEWKGDITKYQKKEVEIAGKLHPLIWNPAPKEKAYIKNNEIEGFPKELE